MFMRLRGGGIGHKATWDWNEFLQRDWGTGRDVSDDDDMAIAGSDSEEADGNNVGVEGDEQGEWEDDEQLNWDGMMENGNDDESDADREGDIDECDDGSDSKEEDEDDLYGFEGYGAL